MSHFFKEKFSKAANLPKVRSFFWSKFWWKRLFSISNFLSMSKSNWKEFPRSTTCHGPPSFVEKFAFSLNKELYYNLPTYNLTGYFFTNDDYKGMTLHLNLEHEKLNRGRPKRYHLIFERPDHSIKILKSGQWTLLRSFAPFFLIRKVRRNSNFSPHTSGSFRDDLRVSVSTWSARFDCHVLPMDQTGCWSMQASSSKKKSIVFSMNGHLHDGALFSIDILKPMLKEGVELIDKWQWHQILQEKMKSDPYIQIERFFWKIRWVDSQIKSLDGRLNKHEKGA